MKRLCLSIIVILSSIISSYACYPERPRIISKVNGILYANADGKWWVAGFEQDQDSVVLKSKVTINGQFVDVKEINITAYGQSCYNTTGCPKTLVIDNGFEVIADLSLPRLEKLYLPKTITRTHDICVLENAKIISENLREIIVDKQNKNFKSENGVLFSKDGKKLYKYPCKKAGTEYTIPQTVESICCSAFRHNNLSMLYFPKKYKSIKDYNQITHEDEPEEESLDFMGFDKNNGIKFIRK